MKGETAPIKKWSIKTCNTSEKTLHLKYGFNTTTFPGFANIIEEYLSGLPENLQANFPSALVKKVPDDWYVKNIIYTYVSPIYFSKNDNGLADEHEMKKILKILRMETSIGRGRCIGLYVAILPCDDNDDNTIRLLPGSKVISYKGCKMLFYTHSAREGILGPNFQWDKHWLLYRLGIKVNIGKKFHPSDAVWYIDSYQGNITDNIVGSSEGKWQLLPERNEQVINGLSLEEVIEKIEAM